MGREWIAAGGLHGTQHQPRRARWSTLRDRNRSQGLAGGGNGSQGCVQSSWSQGLGVRAEGRIDYRKSHSG